MYRISTRFLVTSIRKKCILENNRSTNYATETKSHLTINDIPRPRRLPLVGTSIDLWLAGGGTELHNYVHSRHNQLGPIFCEKLGGYQDLVFISDPGLIKTVFLTLEGKHPVHILPEPWVLYEKLHGSKRGLFFMNGEEWLNNRRIMNKLLLRDNCDYLIDGPVNVTIAKFIDKWKAKALADGDFIPDLETDFYRLSTDVLVAILLGTKSSILTSCNDEELMHTFSGTVKKIFQTTTDLYGLPTSWCQRLNLKIWRDFEECVHLSLFLAQKMVIEIMDSEEKSNGLLHLLSQEGDMSKDTIIRIIADFIIAAGDTTAYTLMWLMYCLMHYDQGHEIRNKEKSYVQYYVKEAMRLYPVAPFLTRILPQNSDLGPYSLEKGTPIIASIYTSSRNEQNFSQPDQFLPYRWDRTDSRKKNLKNHVTSASLPFALGSRSCIGRKIALKMLTEAVYNIANNFNFEYLNNTDIKPITSQILIPDKPIKFIVNSRQ